MNNSCHSFLLFIVCSFSFCLSASCSEASSDQANSPDAKAETAGLNEADCVGFAQNAVNASTMCGTPLPGNAESTLVNYCKKGVRSASMCGGNAKGGLECFKTPDGNDFQCVLGSALPSCDGDLASALGMYCLVALGNPNCASGIRCELDIDCSNNAACNDTTKQCFSKSANCIGLPCALDIDCPDKEKCNSAEHACVGQ
jgi:hypothetical protein